MSRPTDWDVLSLPRDPTPGEPATVRALARRLGRVADDAEQARAQVRGLVGDSAVLEWVGLSGDAFRAQLGELPGQLDKLADSYARAERALATWAGDLDSAQAQADRALVQGRAARADLDRALGELSAATSAATGAATTVQTLAIASEPDPDQVRSATRRAQAAAAQREQVETAVAAAEARLEAAKRLARDAQSMREDAGRRTAAALDDAAEAGIPPNSFWDDLTSVAGKVWSVTVTVAKVVVAVGSIVALIVGGPIAWVVVGAALLVLADTLAKKASGEASWLDVGLALLACIPATKGLTTAGQLAGAFRTGGALGAVAHVGGAAKGVVTAGVQGARAVFANRAAIPALTRAFLSQGAARLSTEAAALRQGLTSSRQSFIAGYDEGATLVGSLRGGVSTGLAGFRDARATFLATNGFGDPVLAARAAQASSTYPGVDPWDPDLWRLGSRREAGYPGIGQDAFVVPEGTLASVGNQRNAYFEGVQVGPRAAETGVTAEQAASHAYRPSAVTFEATSDIHIATSTATANPQYGAGGLTQHFVPDFASHVEAGRITAVDNAGRPVLTTVDRLPDGRVSVNVHGTNGVLTLDGLTTPVSPGVFTTSQVSDFVEGTKGIIDTVQLVSQARSAAIRAVAATSSLASLGGAAE